MAADSAHGKDQIIVGTIRKPKEATSIHVLLFLFNTGVLAVARYYFKVSEPSCAPTSTHIRHQVAPKGCALTGQEPKTYWRGQGSNGMAELVATNSD